MTKGTEGGLLDMAKKLIVLGIALTMLFSLFTLAACVPEEDEKMSCEDEKTPYNATFVSSEFSFKSEFLEENRISGVSYKNEDWNPEDGNSCEYMLDETAPKFRTFIIKERDELDEVFAVFPEINFEKNMVVMYLFRGFDGVNRHIKNIKISDKSLVIELNFVRVSSGYNNLTEPKCISLIIKLDKLDVSEVEFIKL